MQLDVEMSPPANVLHLNFQGSSTSLGKLIDIAPRFSRYWYEFFSSPDRQTESDAYEPIVHKHRWAEKWSNLALMWAHLPLFGPLTWPWRMTFDLDSMTFDPYDLLLPEIWILVQWQTDGQKAMHKSPLCISTCVPKKAISVPFFLAGHNCCT